MSACMDATKMCAVMLTKQHVIPSTHRHPHTQTVTQRPTRGTMTVRYLHHTDGALALAPKYHS